jgi:CRP-like cAMP-binding protein
MDWARLKKISLFEEIPDEELQRFAVLAGEGSVHEGTELVHQGDFAYELFAIEEGSAEVRRDGEVVADLGPGDVFGEIGVAEHELRSASVVATSPVRLIWFSHWDVRRLRKALPEADRRLAELIEQRRR